MIALLLTSYFPYGYCFDMSLYPSIAQTVPKMKNATNEMRNSSGAAVRRLSSTYVLSPAPTVKPPASISRPLLKKYPGPRRKKFRIAPINALVFILLIPVDPIVHTMI